MTVARAFCSLTGFRHLINKSQCSLQSTFSMESKKANKKQLCDCALVHPADISQQCRHCIKRSIRVADWMPRRLNDGLAIKCFQIMHLIMEHIHFQHLLQQKIMFATGILKNHFFSYKTLIYKCLIIAQCGKKL